MRILMLAHRMPYPPHTGDKVRAFHIARHLARRHDLTLAFLVDEPSAEAAIDALRREIGRLEFAALWRPWGLLKGLAGFAAGGPVTLPYFSSARLRRRVAGLLGATPHDLVYVSSSSMAQYVDERTATPVVMDFVDVDSDKWSQYAERTPRPLAGMYRAEGARLRRYEGDVARWAWRCLLATRAEEALLRSFAPWARTAVVPNGVDLEYFSPVEESAAPPTLLFTGAMDYLPNIDAVEYFCGEIFPLVRRELPAARFLIVGLNPAARVRRLAALPGVSVTGTVPDVRPYYAQASVCVAPLRIARGVQNKILQAMAMARPVVATSLACQGLAARPGEHLLVEDAREPFAARLVDLLRDPGERAALGGRGRQFVLAQHSWAGAMAELDRLLDAVAACEPAPLASRGPAR